ncbi:hypothetical protein E3P91_00846 [Wallemia ichthyophaga]|nr:hypothetical protein E3P91_00846 [Wallemia ichthyophaga]TIB64796.1 hypothetical protein E3P78_00996 [Wallemia ichthyophaga]
MRYDRLANDSESDNEGDDRGNDFDHFELEPLAGSERVQLPKDGQRARSRHSSIIDAVTAIVPESDDPSLPTLTIRVIVIGSVFVSLGQDNAPQWNPFIVLLSSYPVGKLMEKSMPHRRFLGINLNPGTFNIKEHCLISILATSGGTAAYASDVLAICTLYFKVDFPTWVAVALILTSQFIGYSFAGLGYNILVKPLNMVYPANLPTISVLTTLHETNQLKRSKVDKKLKFFIVSFVAVILYQLLPSLFAPTLTSIAFLCYFSNNWVMRALGSGYQGFGMLDFSLDWSALSSLGPLYTPPDALFNMCAGLVGMVWIVGPLIYFTDFWNALSFDLPMSTGLFTKNHQAFDVQGVLTPDLKLDLNSWDQQKPLLLTPYFSVFYLCSFATFTATIVHVILWYSGDIKASLLSARKEKTSQEEVAQSVPKSYYISTFVITFVVAAIACAQPIIQLPFWALSLSVLMAAVCLIPLGIIRAVSGQSIGLNVLSELVIGYIMPGKPVANAVFKTFAYNSLSQSLDLIEDSKLGMMIHCPQKDVFICQYIGTAIGAIVNFVVLQNVIDTKRPYLDGTLVDPTGQYTGRSPRIMFSASVIWGLVGPARFFVGKYKVLLISGFILGLILPILTWAVHKRYPRLGFKHISFPLILFGANLVPQMPANVIVSLLIVGYISQYVVRRKYPTWYANNFILSAALDAGTSISAFFAYLALPWILVIVPIWFLNPSGDAEHCR